MRQDTTMKKLQKKLKRLEAKFEKLHPLAHITRARLIKSAQSVEVDIKKLKITACHGCVQQKSCDGRYEDCQFNASNHNSDATNEQS